jgi:hypothetical protein
MSQQCSNFNRPCRIVSFSGLFDERYRGAENYGKISFPLPAEALPAPLLLAT